MGCFVFQTSFSFDTALFTNYTIKHDKQCVSSKQVEKKGAKHAKIRGICMFFFCCFNHIRSQGAQTPCCLDRQRTPVYFSSQATSFRMYLGTSGGTISKRLVFLISENGLPLRLCFVVVFFLCSFAPVLLFWDRC